MSDIKDRGSLRLATPSTGECVAVFTLLSKLKFICIDMREREREAADIIVQLHASGMSERAIAAEIGRSGTWVHYLRDWAARDYEGTPFGPQSKEARRRRNDAQAPKQATDNVVPFPTSQPDADASRSSETSGSTAIVRQRNEYVAADAAVAAIIDAIGSEKARIVFCERLGPTLADNPFLILKIIRVLEQRLRGAGTVMVGGA